jgi:nitrogen-specific signal transduction histidine kinase
VQAVVTAHGGTVTVWSRLGHTVFAVELPAAYDSQTGHRHITQP